MIYITDIYITGNFIINKTELLNKISNQAIYTETFQ